MLLGSGNLLSHVRVIDLVLHVLSHCLLSLIHLLHVGRGIVVVLQLLAVIVLCSLDLTS